MSNAIRFDVVITKDHMIRLPDDVPEGPAEVVIAVFPHAAAPKPLRKGFPFGLDRGKIHVAADFDALPDDIQKAFEGDGT